MTETNVKTLPTMHGGARIRAIVPETFEDVQRLAKTAVASGLFQGVRKDTDEEKLAKAIMAIMQGLEVGLPPTQAVQCIAVIKGKCVIYGDAVPGLLWSKGFKLEQWIDGEGDARTAHCAITRPTGERIVRTFSRRDAKKARLFDDRPIVKDQWDGKDKPNDSPWFRFEDRMLGWRALGFAKADGASDVTRGLYLREEIDDGEPEMRDVTPRPALEAPPIPPAPHPAASPEQVSGPTPGPGKEAFLIALRSEMVAAKDLDALNEIFEAKRDLIMGLGVDIEAQEFYDELESRFTD